MRITDERGEGSKTSIESFCMGATASIRCIESVAIRRRRCRQKIKSNAVLNTTRNAFLATEGKSRYALCVSMLPYSMAQYRADRRVD